MRTKLSAVAAGILVILAACGGLLFRSNPDARGIGYAFLGLVFAAAIAVGVAIRGKR
ncbi:hypothetical protein ACIQGZ_27110 [Streptomyces sp. NPDC092296]|uniref:hypothetical protein n=1 Tax=Streptomyces sp. NPDC092296 TaxID=3366012 RepID=UPI0037F7E92E